MNLVERVRLYNDKYQKYPKIFHNKGYIIGVWIIGNYYRNETDYYGAYPHSYLDRISCMFPDCKEILHLFSGSLDNVEGIRVDLNSKAKSDLVADAHNLSAYFDEGFFDIIYADPPYSKEDAEHYGLPMINRNKVIKECVYVIKDNKFIVWLDQVFPMYRKDELKLIGTIGLIRSTNHRVRTCFIFQRRERNKRKGLEKYVK